MNPNQPEARPHAPTAHRRRRIPTLARLAALAAIAGSTALQAAAPSLLPNASTYLPGEDIVVSFADGPGNPKDWIGVYPPEEIPDGTPGSTAWRYVDGTQSGALGLKEGSITFPGGLNIAGDWTVYLLLNDGYDLLATNTFKVVDPATPLVRLPQRVFGAGQKIEVTFTNGPANAKDWIGVYPADEIPDGNPASLLWSYVDGTGDGTTGRADGTISFPTGLAQPGTYAVHLLLDDGYDLLATETFTVVPATGTAPRILSLSPADGAANQPPVLRFSAVITNGTFQLVASSVVLKLDGAAVPATVTSAGESTTVAYTDASLPAAGSAHTWVLTANDNATPPNTLSAQSTTTIGAYQNIVLPAPLHFENFDGLAEGSLPTGWSTVGYAPAVNEAIDFGDLGSAAYSQWTAVGADRFTGSFVTYGDPNNPAGWGLDYRRVLTGNPFNVLNSKVLDGPLATGRFLFGNSGYHNGGAGQFLTLYTSDYNLSGKTNIHVAFKSLWEQNQDSLAALEYSVDRGATWLPVFYLLHGPDIVTVSNELTGEITVDAEATFNTEAADIAVVTDDQGNELGRTYGAFIGAPVSPALAPYLQARIDDNPVESKRVEYHRLPHADNQASVRLRFAHAGTDSWYWGIDDFGLYSISPPTTPPGPLGVKLAAGKVEVTYQGTLQAADTPTGPWSDVPGAASPYATTPSGAAKFFRSR